MTNEEFYGDDNYKRLINAQNALCEIAEKLKSDSSGGDDVQPIVYYCSRIKKPDSMVKKLEQRGFPPTRQAALRDVYDAVGLRIICSFESDVHYIVERLENLPDISVREKKDYLSYPKPNGYRSIHLCAEMTAIGVLCEIQVRTIAMDFWATLEHQLKYKKSISNETLIINELKRCADEIASTDLSMQTIREIINEL